MKKPTSPLEQVLFSCFASQRHTINRLYLPIIEDRFL